MFSQSPDVRVAPFQEISSDRRTAIWRGQGRRAGRVEIPVFALSAPAHSVKIESGARSRETSSLKQLKSLVITKAGVDGANGARRERTGVTHCGAWRVACGAVASWPVPNCVFSCFVVRPPANQR